MIPNYEWNETSFTINPYLRKLVNEIFKTADMITIQRATSDFLDYCILNVSTLNIREQKFCNHLIDILLHNYKER